MVARGGTGAGPTPGVERRGKPRKRATAGAGGSPHLGRRGPLETLAGPGVVQPEPSTPMGLPTSLTAEDEALPVAYRVLWPLLTSALISQSRFQFLNRAQCLPAEGPAR